MSDNEPLGYWVIPEVKATTILSIRDTLRQRSLSIEDAAAIVGMETDELRGIVEAGKMWDVAHVPIETLGRILEALEAPGRQP